MRTLFVTAPFGRYDMGGYAPPAYGRPVPLVGGALGYSHVRGDLTSPPDMSGPAEAPRQLWLGRDFATDRHPLAFLGQDQSDIGGLTKLIEDALKEVPPEVLGGYQDRYKQCQDLVAKGGVVGLAAGGKCLSDLYQDIKKAMKHPTPAAPPMAPPPPPPAPFPVLPVAIAVVGAGVLVFGLTRL